MRNFEDINDLYDEAKLKYVGYVLNYKWFESWKVYVSTHYGVSIQGFSNNLTYSRTIRTTRSIRTKKTFKTIKSIKSSRSIANSVKSMKKILNIPRARELRFEGKDLGLLTKNYDLVYSNIGEKPR